MQEIDTCGGLSRGEIRGAEPDPTADLGAEVFVGTGGLVAVGAVVAVGGIVATCAVLAVGAVVEVDTIAAVFAVATPVAATVAVDAAVTALTPTFAGCVATGVSAETGKAAKLAVISKMLQTIISRPN